MSRKTDTVVARTIGIDTGKNTLHLIGLDDRGAIVLREKLTRGRIAARLANVPQCLIGIEAGMATHCVARELIALGHDVKQVPPVYAKPFRELCEFVVADFFKPRSPRVLQIPRDALAPPEYTAQSAIRHGRTIKRKAKRHAGRRFFLCRIRVSVVTG